MADPVISVPPGTTDAILPMPPGISLDLSPSEMRIMRRWNRGAGAAMLAFAIFWDGFLVFWYSMAFGMRAPLIFVLFPLIHVAVGVAITYAALANLLNTTTVTVAQGLFKIAHAPLPWFQPATFHTWELQQLYTKQHVSRGKNGSTTTYSLDAVMQDGRTRTLVSNMESVEQGRFLEARLEQYIGLIDSKVAGEARR